VATQIGNPEQDHPVVQRRPAPTRPVRPRAVRSVAIDDPAVDEELGRREAILQRWLLLGDGLAAVVVFAPLPWAAGDGRIAALALVAVAVLVIANRLAGLHRAGAHTSRREALVLAGVVTAVAVVAGLVHLALTGDAPALGPVALVAAGGLLALLAARELARLVAARGLPAQRWLLLEEADPPAYDRLDAILHQHAIDRVVRVPPELSGEAAMRTARRAVAAGVWVGALPGSAEGRTLS
jgi:hypothetical protein